MNDLTLLPIFLVGLLGSVHCAGMCGGIVSAFSAVPVRVTRRTGGSVAAGMAGAQALSRVLIYNAGRLASYATAGAIAGGMTHSLRTIALFAPIQLAGYWLANLMLVALGLYLMDAWHGLVHVEALGRRLWRHLQPLLRHVMPADTPGKTFALGTLWGWVPCGMVYSVLLTAMARGSAAGGSAVMLAFGLGTLPMLLALGVLGARLRSFASARAVRVGGGLLVLSFGIIGMLRAAHDLPHSWLDTFCASPPFVEHGGSR
jgi:uncharacterized protein